MQIRSKQKKCVHYWVIDDPDGVYSFGRCTRCGLVKRFINNWEEILAMNVKDGGTTKTRLRN